MESGPPAEQPPEEQKASSEPPALFSGEIDYSKNDAIKSKCFVTLKVKPLGSGASDIISATV